MREQGGGSIINIASIEGLRPSRVLGVTVDGGLTASGAPG
jgi:hypothetical protein